MCPRIEPLPAPLKSVEAGRRGYCARVCVWGVGAGGGGCRLQRNYRVATLFLTCSTLHLPLSELPLPSWVSVLYPSLHPCPLIFLSLPSISWSTVPASCSCFLCLSPSLSLYLLLSLGPCSRSPVSLPPPSVSPRCLISAVKGDLSPCSSCFSPLGVDSSSLSSSSSPPCSLFPGLQVS